MKNKIIISSLALSVLTFCVGLYGATYNWTGSGNDFNDTDNWDGTPNFTVTNTYVFNTALGAKTIELSGDVQNASLQFNSGYSGDVTIDLKTFALNMNGFVFLRSQQGTALAPEKVTFKGGSQTSFYAISVEGNMDVTLDGIDFTSTNPANFFRMGGASSTVGNSTVRLVNGAKVSLAGTQVTYIGNGTQENNLFVVNGAGTSLNAGGFDNALAFSVGTGNSKGNEFRVENGGTFVGLGQNQIGNGNNASGNKLTVTGSGSNAALQNTYIGTSNSAWQSKNNQIEVKNQGVLTNKGFLQVGGAYVGSTENKLSVSGGGVVETEELRLQTGSEIEFKDGLIAVGKGTYNDAVTIGDGLTGTAVYRMTDVLDKTHTFNDALTLNSNARLEGVGTLNGIVYTNSGAVVSVGIHDGGVKTFGTLAIDATGGTDWDNSGVELIVSLGDLSSGVAVAGVNHDLLTFGSHYTLLTGGQVTVDLSNYILFDEESPFADFKVVAWDAYSGDLNNIQVAFDGGSALSLGYRLEGDGLYITAVPEPSTWVSMLGGVVLLIVLFRNKKVEGGKR